MTAVVQREQSTTMASMGGFGNNIIVSHRIHRGSQTGTGASRPAFDPTTCDTPSTSSASSSGPLLITQPQDQPHLTSPVSPTSTEAPPSTWGPEVLSGPAPPGLSVAVGVDDVFGGGEFLVGGVEDSLPGPSSSSSSSQLLSSTSFSPSLSSSSTAAAVAVEGETTTPPPLSHNTGTSPIGPEQQSAG